MANNTPSKKRDFFNDEEFSDVIVRFANQQIFAHKVVLASGSVWFEKALCGNFSPDAIMAMLRHLYGSKYENQKIYIEPNSTAEFHLAIFMLGDKYDIESLREEAADLFMTFLQDEVQDFELYNGNLHAIQKLVGPDAPQLADRSLAETAQACILVHFESLFANDLFRELMASGTMLNESLALGVLDKIYKKKF
ncbi:unnamed protein product [Aureobasidium mustum]|uniref:BTB domain-containing protein n=1 Tax=Aureobasidium mustum TaxID=2773714 RepID=A0A9N8KC80_9PEZI|nr:unnamed protein product [Aureobasidium mustum]